MKQNLLKTCLVMLFAVFGMSMSWAGSTVTTYTFNSKSWGATCNGSTANWTGSKDGNQYSASNSPIGVQILAAGNGTTVTSPKAFTNVSKVVVNYSSSSKGVGSIKVSVGGTDISTLSIAKSQSKTDLTYTPDTKLSGNVVITCNCTANSYALVSVSITEESGGSTPEPTKYDITVSDAIANGTVTASSTSAAEGATVTLTATPDAGYMFSAWDVKGADNSPITVTDNKFTMPAQNVTVSATFAAIPIKTIAEFIASEGGKCYLTGIVSNIDNNTYGNFDLTDESGTIYIYGCLTPEGEARQFASLDVVAGDKIKVLADVYELYSGKDEAKNVVFVEELPIEKPQYTVTIETPENGTLVVKNGETVLASGDQVEQGETLTIECTPANADYRFRNWQYKEGEDSWKTRQTNPQNYTMPSANVQFRANFELIPVYTVAWSVNGSIVKTEDLKEGAAVTAPADPEAMNGKVFVGWVTSSSVAADATPEYVTPSATATASVTYYAVFASYDDETTPAQWQITNLADLTSSDVFVMANGTNAISSENGTSGNPPAVALTVSAGKITSEVTEAIQWKLAGNAADGYTFYQNSSTKFLYVNTTASSGSNTCIRVGNQSSNIRNNWKLDTNGYLMTNDTYTARYLSFYSTGSDFRGYVNTNNGAFAPTFYKYVPGEDPYSDFTTVPAPYTKQNLVLVAKNEDGYYATFSSSDVTFFPEDYIVSAVGVENGALYTFDNDEAFDEDIVEIDGEDVIGYYVPANTGVLVNSVDDFVNYYTVVGVTPSNDVDAVNMLRPASADMTGDYNFYKLAYDNYDAKTGLGFYWGAEDGAAFTAKTGGAYLAVPKSAGSIKGFRFDGGDVTGIQAAAIEKSDVIYNLQGQRVVAPKAGVYVKNGKKVVVK